MLGHLESVAKTAYEGFEGGNKEEDDDDGSSSSSYLPGPLAALRSALDSLTGKKKKEEEKVAEEEGGEGEEEEDKTKTPKRPLPSGRARFVAARVDFMSRAASHVRFTPTVSVYRGSGSKKRVVDGFHGGDAQRLADRAWLHLGGGRRRWGWC